MEALHQKGNYIIATKPKKDLFPSWSGKRKSLSPPFRGDERAELLPFGEKLVEASHARLAWPWASQATARGRLRVPAVLATRVPRACERAAGCTGGRRAPAHRVVRGHVSFRMRAPCTARASSLLSSAAGAGDSKSLG